MAPESVTRLDPEDSGTAAALSALLNRELGDGLYEPAWLLEDAANPAAAVWVARAPDPVGAAVARLLGPNDGEYYRRFGAVAMRLFEAGAGPVGSFEAVAVAPPARRRGLGARLTTTSLDWMRERGCAAAVTVSWRSGRAGSSAGLFRRLGMAEGPTVDGFYREESLRDGWSCPVCGRPCACAATLFTLSLA
jgi:GNAT superfamily N-acetyltransferase